MLKGVAMQYTNGKDIGDILLEAGLISDKKLQYIKENNCGEDGKIEKILLSEGVINYKEHLGIMASKMGVEFVDLENIRVNKEAVTVINSEIAVKYKVFPFDIKDRLLFLAMENPDDIFLIDEIKVFTQMEIKPFYADSRLIGRAIKYFYFNDASSEFSAAAENRHTYNPDTAITGKTDNPLRVNEVTGVSNNNTGSIDDFIGLIIKKSLTMDNITDISIDPMNRTLKVNLTIKY